MGSGRIPQQHFFLFLRYRRCYRLYGEPDIFYVAFDLLSISCGLLYILLRFLSPMLYQLPHSLCYSFPYQSPSSSSLTALEEEQLHQSAQASSIVRQEKNNNKENVRAPFEKPPALQRLINNRSRAHQSLLLASSQVATRFTIMMHEFTLLHFLLHLYRPFFLISISRSFLFFVSPCLAGR